jgi:hypothetical protein
MAQLDTAAWAKDLARNFRLLSDALGGPEAVSQLPVLDLGDATNFTGYIDWLEPEHLSAPVMIGRDCHGRAFVAVKAQVEQDGQDGGAGRDFVVTLFQRYSDQLDCWAWGTHDWDLPSRVCSDMISDGHRLSDYAPEKAAKVVELLSRRRVAVGDLTLVIAQ